MIGRVTLDNKSFTGAVATMWRIAHEIATRNRPTGIEITVFRDMDKATSTQGFALATNRNGTEKRFDGEVEVWDNKDKVMYKLAFTKGILQNYSEKIPENPTDKAIECWVIFASDFSITVGTETVELKPAIFSDKVLKR